MSILVKITFIAILFFWSHFASAKAPAFIHLGKNWTLGTKAKKSWTIDPTNKYLGNGMVMLRHKRQPALAASFVVLPLDQKGPDSLKKLCQQIQDLNRGQQNKYSMISFKGQKACDISSSGKSQPSQQILFAGKGEFVQVSLHRNSDSQKAETQQLLEEFNYSP